MTKLHVHDLETRDRLVYPDTAGITPASPALAVLTDFRREPPPVIEGSARAQHAAEIMMSEHQHMKLVVDADETLRGIIGLEDMSEQGILQWGMENGVCPTDVLVADVMHPRRFLLCMDYEEFSLSNVADVLEVLQAQRQQYCLVVDKLSHKIIGVLDHRDIVRRINEELALRFALRQQQRHRQARPAPLL